MYKKMISQQVRDKLRARIKKGDYNIAANIYMTDVNRYVSSRYLQQFLDGTHKVTGRKDGGHNPLDMFAAITEAVKRREDEERIISNKALEMLQQKINVGHPGIIPQ